jgi:hypothetical protein
MADLAIQADSVRSTGPPSGFGRQTGNNPRAKGFRPRGDLR